MGSSPEGEHGRPGSHRAGKRQTERHARAGVLCQVHQAADCHTGPVYCPGRQTSLEPWQAVERQWHRMRSGPVYAWGILFLLWPAAEDLSMTPAALERLSCHLGLPTPEPMAEYACSEANV